MVDIRVLGPLEVADDDGPVALGAAKPRRLLAALVVAGGRPCSPTRLIDVLWGDSPAASAPKLLQVYTSHLRKTLPVGVAITTSAHGYALEFDPEALDAVRFERLLAEGRAALADANPTLAAALLHRALALWRGPAYAEIADDDVARGAIERVEELRLGALEERVEAELRLGRHAELLPELRAAASANPLRERFHGQLMLALYRCDRQSEALDVHRALRDRMREELGLDPTPELRELERQILNHDPQIHSSVAAAPAERLSLPASPNPLVGRDRELGQLRALLARTDARLLVLTGAGGSGKTRLALEVARKAAGQFANGVAVVELAPIRDPDLVVTAISRALDVREAPDGSPLDTLVESVRGQELLLVIDNAEHLPTATPVLVELIARLPRLTLLVTSRRVLHLSGEHVFPVPPLAHDDAVRLFVERARAMDPSFELTSANAPEVGDICRRVDGLPLAVELAAARITVLSPTALRERLASRLTVLARGPHDLPARQQALRDTLTWSAELLAPEERRDFARLAVFAGAWTMEAAEAICDTDLDRLAALVDLHLVHRRDSAEGSPLVMLETVHEFAAELLATSGEATEVQRRHALHYVAVAEQADTALGGPDQMRWLDRLESDHVEIRAAQAWLATARDVELELRLVSAVGRFRYVRGYLAEGRAALEAALARAADAPPDLLAKASRVASAICVLQGDWKRGHELASAALALYEAAGDARGVARSLSNLGAILTGAGEHAEARRALDSAVIRARALDDRRILALSLNNRGDLALIEADWDTAIALFTESLSLLRALGDEANIARSLFNLGVAVLETGPEQDAGRLLIDSLDQSVELDDKEDVAWCLIAIGALCAHRREPDAGVPLVGAADDLLAAIGASLKPYERGLRDRAVTALRGQVDDDRFVELLARSRQLTLAEVVGLARRAAEARP